MTRVTTAVTRVTNQSATELQVATLIMLCNTTIALRQTALVSSCT
jgi:hypothetical protein